MSGFHVHGPTLTYVTDPSLTWVRQLDVLARFIRCAPGKTLRVGFRIPGASDDQVDELYNRYLQVVKHEGVAELMLPPLIHNRLALVARYPACALWLSTQWLNEFHASNTYSVHSMAEAMAAFDAGASELIFGHVFVSESHPGEPGRGIAALQQVAATMRMDDVKPVITAIGGIHEESIRAIGRAGVRSVACIRAISRSTDIPRALRSMLQEWNFGYAEFLQKGPTN